jgi:hypothetical protein
MVSMSTRVATTLAAFGLSATTALLVAAPASALEGPNCNSYSATAQSDTTVVITTGDVEFGESFDVEATVTSDGQSVDGGEVVFNYRGTKKVVEVEDGTATTSFVARRGNQNLTARYRGVCLDGQVSIAGSEGAQILGVEAFAGGPGKNAGGGPVVAGVDELADTGLAPFAQLIGLTGAALVAAGGATLMIRRRRVTI